MALYSLSGVIQDSGTIPNWFEKMLVTPLYGHPPQTGCRLILLAKQLQGRRLLFKGGRKCLFKSIWNLWASTDTDYAQ